MKKLIHSGMLTAIAASCLLGCDSGEEVSLATKESSIYYGTRTPTSISLTDGQLLALGWLHSAGRPSSSFCSGTIITPRVVVTARHCFNDGDRASELGFSIGMLRESPIHTFALSNFVVHDTLDIAVLILAENAVEAVPGLTPIPQNRTPLTESMIGKIVEAAGYGQTADNIRGRWFAALNLINVGLTSIMVDGRGVHGICRGDSGGPALYDFGDGPVVLATESTGSSSCVGQDTMIRLDPSPAADWLDALDPDALSVSPCGGITTLGQCNGDVLEYCYNNQVMHYDCAAIDQICAYQGPVYGYACKAKANNCGDVSDVGICVVDEDGTNKAKWCQDGELLENDCAAENMACTVFPNGSHDCASTCDESVEPHCSEEFFISCIDGFLLPENCAASGKTCTLNGCLSEEIDAGLDAEVEVDAELDAEVEVDAELDAEVEVDAELDAEVEMDAGLDAEIDSAVEDAAIETDASVNKNSSDSGCSFSGTSGQKSFWPLGLLALSCLRKRRRFAHSRT